jgi:8-oxo-dGTP pyrophosphatase MutT (NUDIX family)
MTNPPLQVRQAATVVLLRDRIDGPPDLLLMERAASMAFAPGALVFPGGGIDPADLALAERLATGLPLDEAAARIAALRETLEESGLGIGLPHDFPADGLAAMRRALADGAPFADLLAEQGMTLDLEALTPFARWHPAALEKAIRVYDTRFYLARAPEGQEARADATENVHLFWASAAAVLARCAAGNGRVIFPTRRNLERLAQFDSFAAAVSHANAIPVEKVTPWVEERVDGRHLCIPTHLGYPVTSELLWQVSRH